MTATIVMSLSLRVAKATRGEIFWFFSSVATTGFTWSSALANAHRMPKVKSSVS